MEVETPPSSSSAEAHCPCQNGIPSKSSRDFNSKQNAPGCFMMSDVEEEKIRSMLRDAVTVLCRNSILFQQQLTVQGLLAVTVDSDSVVILQVNEVVEKSPDGSVSVINSAGDGSKPCECCCKCKTVDPPSPKAPTYVNAPKCNMVAPSAGPHILRQTTDTEQIAQSLVTLGEPVKGDMTTDRDKLRETLGIEVQMPDAKQDTGPFVAGVAGKTAKVVHIAPSGAATANSTREDFHQSQLASFASLAHDINLGTAAATCAEVGVAWYHPPGIQLAPIAEPTRSSSQERLMSQSAATTTVSVTATTPKSVPMLTDTQIIPEMQLSSADKKALRAEKARLYRLSMRNNPALKHKYEETKRKNRERMQRHRMLMTRPSRGSHQPGGGGLTQISYQVTAATAGTQVRPRTPSSSPDDSKVQLWHDIHNWQNQPLGLSGATPLVTHALQSHQMLIPASVVESSTVTPQQLPHVAFICLRGKNIKTPLN
ncbi:hypothetical protein CAPTEDRAFT_210651 [Capitella teleta]|uniref:Uncharacterized protein n=1 Tax=Capitella teleta TaxID=283909 RepID=R7VAM6_CAPTE|nr:hypothetical protein CAPTEDRAFT_210651 [Capitella teleta]|eukprot:ELU15587.1 hypothetical protein CAPTEDRAFT_210651 [Capitella teleta]